MDDRDIYRSAKLFIDEYGADAPIHAAMKADAMLERGDLHGVAVWNRVMKTIEDMQRTQGRVTH